jgi:hypothetical protein
MICEAIIDATIIFAGIVIKVFSPKYVELEIMLMRIITKNPTAR